MPRSRPATDPLSFHKPTGQFYVTRGGRRVYLGADRGTALEKYHHLALGQAAIVTSQPPPVVSISAKELANRFLAAQQANWRNLRKTLSCYRDWLGRFLRDHPGLRAGDLTVEMFAAWKLSLRRRKYSAESINHYLSAVRAMYRFAEEAELLRHSPRLRRVKNESSPASGSKDKPLYTAGEVQTLLAHPDLQLRGMILLSLNCGFGPKDIRDLTWKHIDGDRVTLPRSKTGVCQTFLLWPETFQVLEEVTQHRRELIERLAKRGRRRSDNGHVFVTKFWRPWSSDAVAEQFRKLCRKVGVPCYGLYRLRHCASTAMSLVASPHVQRRFMRHAQLQQQVTYTHTPDAEVDLAIAEARTKLLGPATEDSESGPEQAEVA
jgi:integrase